MVDGVVFYGTCATIVEGVALSFVLALMRVDFSRSFSNLILDARSLPNALVILQALSFFLARVSGNLQNRQICFIRQPLLHPLLRNPIDECAFLFLLNTMEILFENILEHVLELNNLQLTPFIPFVHFDDLCFKLLDVFFLFIIYLFQILDEKSFLSTCSKRLSIIWLLRVEAERI